MQQRTSSAEETMKTVHQDIVEKLPAIVYAGRVDPADGKFRWLYLSDAMLGYYGFERAELLERPEAFTERVVPEDREGYIQAVSLSAGGTGTFEWEGRVVRAGGDVRWVQSVATVEHDADGIVTWYGMTVDRTEYHRAQSALVEATRALEEQESLLRAVIDHLPVPISVMDADGRFIVYNDATRRMVGETTLAADTKELEQTYGLFEPEGRTPMPVTDLPITRALRGEQVTGREVIMRNGAASADTLLSVTAIPLRRADGAVWAALAVTNDITATRRLEDEVRARNTELLASEEAKTALIERLRYAIDELSTPVLEVWDDVLVTPVIGVIDSRRMAEMVDKLLAEIVRTQAQFVLVDLTGVDLVDTKTAEHLIKMVRKAELIGARCLLTGVQPAVAQTLVDIGVDFGRLVTLRNLKHGLRECLRQTRDREARRQRDVFAATADAPAAD
jgi:rsbT co-antagonist protein RsbR